MKVDWQERVAGTKEGKGVNVMKMYDVNVWITACDDYKL